MPLLIVLSLLIGYLIGSISPAYFFGRVLKGIDIRKVEDRNAGATNVYKVMGLWPAVLTAVFDLSKGLISMLIAYYLKVPEVVIYSAGIFTVIGHIFPFYLKFRGGQGSATLVGMMFYFLYQLLKTHFLPVESLIVLALVLLAVIIITKQKGFLALIAMPALGVMIFRQYHINLITIFLGIIFIYEFGLSIYIDWQRDVFKLKEMTKEKILPWRRAMRPLSAIFPILYFYFDKKIVLWILGPVTAIFVLLDLIRLLSKNINLFFF